jgi:hypothetical protein
MIAYWYQKKLFDEKTGDEKSRDTVPLINTIYYVLIYFMVGREVIEDHGTETHTGNIMHASIY